MATATSAVDLMAEIAAEVRGIGPRCKVAIALSEAPSDIADSIRKAIASDYPARAIAIVLRKHEIALGETSIQRHRRKACRCE